MKSTPIRGRRAGMLLVGALTAAVALVGCSGESAPVDDSDAVVDPYAPEVTDILVAGYKNAGGSPVQAAADAGITEEYGISIEIQPSENAAAMLAQLVSGEVPIGMVNGFFSVPAVMQGADLRVIGELIRGVEGVQTLEVLPDSGIDGLEDLAGKRVAVVGLNSGHQGRIASAMIAEGLDPDDVEFVALGWNEMPAALEQGNADAVVVTGPAQLQLRSELGTKSIFDMAAGRFAEFPDAQYLVNGAWADANPNAVAAFQCAAVIRGQELVMEDQAAYEDALRAYGMSEEAIAADVKLIFPAANEPAQIIPDIMFELGWIDSEFDISEITVPLPDNC